MALNENQGFKESMIQQVEQQINKFKKRRKEVEFELEMIERDENEARAMLQLLKTGNAPKMKGGRRLITREEYVEAIQAAGANGSEFTPGDIAELVGSTSSSAASSLKRLAGQGDTIVMVAAGGPGIPSKFKLKGADNGNKRS